MNHRILFLLGFLLIGFALFKPHAKSRVTPISNLKISSVTEATLPSPQTFRRDLPNVQAVLKKTADQGAKLSPQPVAVRVAGTSIQAGQMSEQYRDISEESFLQMSQTVLDSLPTRHDLRKLSDSQLHETPMLVIEGGRSIGRIVEIMEHQPELTVSAAYFFIQCASNPNQITALRALCYRHVEQVSRRLGMNEKKLDGIVPKNVSDLANQMPQQM